jgi:hypothetical protein
VLRHWGFPLNHLHFHSSGHEQLTTVRPILSVTCISFTRLSLEDWVVLSVAAISTVVRALVIASPLGRLV